MASRKQHQITDYEKALRDYHKASPRHVVVFEAEISEDDKRHLFHQADLLRQCGNELLEIMKRRLEQLLRTKKYRGLRKYYGGLNEKLKVLGKVEVPSEIQKEHRQELLAELKSVGDSMKEMQETYQVTWNFCRKTMEHLRLSYGQPSIFALSVRKMSGPLFQKFCIPMGNPSILGSVDNSRSCAQNRATVEFLYP